MSAAFVHYSYDLCARVGTGTCTGTGKGYANIQFACSNLCSKRKIR